jgi:hypothetical protein
MGFLKSAIGKTIGRRGDRQSTHQHAIRLAKHAEAASADYRSSLPPGIGLPGGSRSRVVRSGDGLLSESHVRELHQLETFMNQKLGAALGGCVGVLAGRFWASLVVGFAIAAALFVGVNMFLGPWDSLPAKTLPGNNSAAY